LNIGLSSKIKLLALGWSGPLCLFKKQQTVTVWSFGYDVRLVVRDRLEIKAFAQVKPPSVKVSPQNEVLRPAFQEDRKAHAASPFAGAKEKANGGWPTVFEWEEHRVGDGRQGNGQIKYSERMARN
jgi:hypothetical protein